MRKEDKENLIKMDLQLHEDEGIRIEVQISSDETGEIFIPSIFFEGSRTDLAKQLRTLANYIQFNKFEDDHN